MNAWQVLLPGPLTTVQDRGRDGFRHLGIARAGALDADAAWLANALVGNDEDAALLEFTLRGPKLQLPAPARVALTGAPLQARCNGTPLPMNRPIDLPAGQLDLGAVHGGVRGYLAVAGGIAVAPVLGSRSTDLRGGFGGLGGRALQAGDVLPVAGDAVAAAEIHASRWWIDADRDDDAMQAPIRYVPSTLPAAAMLALQRWRVSPRSDRQGLRLDGEALPAVTAGGLSEPVAPGCIQLPGDGQPIVLLADAQTVGGYPRLGHVIAADLPRLAQLGPHAALRFQPVSLHAAHLAACARRARMGRIVLALQARRA